MTATERYEDDETKTAVEKIGNHRRSSRNPLETFDSRGEFVDVDGNVEEQNASSVDDEELVPMEDFFFFIAMSD